MFPFCRSCGDLPQATSAGSLVSVSPGFMQELFALRVAFGAVLFRHWAEAWRHDVAQGGDPITLDADLRILDQSLAVCRLGKNRDDAMRDLCSHLRGALR